MTIQMTWEEFKEENMFAVQSFVAVLRLDRCLDVIVQQQLCLFGESQTGRVTNITSSSKRLSVEEFFLHYDQNLFGESKWTLR